MISWILTRTWMVLLLVTSVSSQVNGVFSPWSQWDNPACSVSCGPGTQRFTRTRTCTNPRPQFGGLNCTGNYGDAITRTCFERNCPINGVFSPWSQWDNPACSVSCGIGTQRFTRTRTCTNPTPQFGGLNCTGDYGDAIKRTCFESSCPIHHVVSRWSKWDNPACSVSCGPGTRRFTRTRTCINPRPQFEGFNCTGNYSDFITRTCFERSCPINGVFSPWSQWDNPACSVSCGPGIRGFTRTRTCTNPRPQFGGFNCTRNYGDAITRACFEINCPINGGWSNWTPWNDPQCSVTCGGGTRTLTRRRTCDNPRPQFGGAQCSGSPDSSEVRVCSTNNCPINGGWSPWGQWSDPSCTVTCGPLLTAFVTRTRQCDSPAPQFGGNFCFGSPNDVVSTQLLCNLPECPLSINKDLSDLTVLVGSSPVFSTTLSMVNVTDGIWSRNGTVLTTNSRYIKSLDGNNQTLNIPNVQLFESGKYMYRINNTETTGILTVADLVNNVNTTVGGTALFQTYVSPTTSGFWSGKGVPLTSSTKHIITSIGERSELLITNVQKLDGGLYTYTVNGLQSTGTLNVRDNKSSISPVLLGVIIGLLVILLIIVIVVSVYCLRKKYKQQKSVPIGRQLDYTDLDKESRNNNDTQPYTDLHLYAEINAPDIKTSTSSPDMTAVYEDLSKKATDKIKGEHPYIGLDDNTQSKNERPAIPERSSHTDSNVEYELAQEIRPPTEGQTPYYITVF